MADDQRRVAEEAGRDQTLAGARDYTALCGDMFNGFNRAGFTRDEALTLTGIWMELMHDAEFHRRQM